VLALIIFPFVADPYPLTLAYTLFSLLAGTELDLLGGYTGLVSLGQAAFFGLGAYTTAILLHTDGPSLLCRSSCQWAHRDRIRPGYLATSIPLPRYLLFHWHACTGRSATHLDDQLSLTGGAQGINLPVKQYT